MISVFHRLYAYWGITPACSPDAFCGCCVEWEVLARGGGGGADRRDPSRVGLGQRRGTEPLKSQISFQGPKGPWGI
jgi:hypothetical protein